MTDNEEKLALRGIDLPDPDWPREWVDAFHAVSSKFFFSDVWFVWCGPHPQQIVNEDGEVARYRAAKLAVETLKDLGWSPPA